MPCETFITILGGRGLNENFGEVIEKGWNSGDFLVPNHIGPNPALPVMGCVRLLMG